MPTTVPFTCYNFPGSQGETALPKPWPCCGWANPPASLSGTYRCTSTPTFLCGGEPTTTTAFTLLRNNLCGAVYLYNAVGINFYINITLSLCTEPTGAIVGSIGSPGPGIWTPDSTGNGCSFVGGAYNFVLGGTLQNGGQVLRIDFNSVTM